MRAPLLLLLAAAAIALAEPENLLPREGSGWEGFKAGTTVKTRTTFGREDLAPTFTTTEQRLVSLEEKELSFAATVKEALGVESKHEWKVPRKGEAGAGEKEHSVEKLANEEVAACEKKFACTVTRTTVETADGKRIITEWRAADPRVRVKRSERTVDKEGKTTSNYSMVLAGMGEKLKVGTREISCLRYRTLRVTGNREAEGEAWLSREVPGATVKFEEKHTEDGRLLLAVRIECLDFEAK